jgi:hypothetical protein
MSLSQWNSLRFNSLGKTELGWVEKGPEEGKDCPGAIEAAIDPALARDRCREQ